MIHFTSLFVAALIFLFPYLPDSKTPTLTKSDFFAASESSDDYPRNGQLLYRETFSDGHNYIYSKSLQIYGNAVSLVTIDEFNGKEESHMFYYFNNDNIFVKVVNSLIESGLFETKTCGKFNIGGIGDNTHGYYLSLRIGDRYYSIAFSGYDNEEPVWLPLVREMQSNIEELSINENIIDVKDYLEIREEIVKEYGYHVIIGDRAIKRYAGRDAFE